MSHTNAPEKFHGVDFKRRQEKMLFYLMTMDYVKYLEEDAPIVAELEHDPQILSNADIWKQANYMCRNYVLNGLQDPLYNVYGIKKTSKELWLSLEKRFSTEDAGTKKFVVYRFLDFLRLRHSLLRHTSVEQAIMD